MSIVDGIISTEITNGTIATIDVIDPSLNGSILSTTIDPNAPIDPEAIRDNRISANTGKLVHNWWISYMKSLKKSHHM